jgi:cysteine synthase
VAGVHLLLKNEGIAVGLSSGANIAACLKIARTASKPLRMLCLAYDQMAPYLDAL